MIYRTVADLNDVIVRSLPRLPRNICAVVGVPRSGLLAATMMALHLNLPVADLDGFLEGRILSGGERLMGSFASTSSAKVRRVIIVDDSVATGNAIAKVKAKIELSCKDIEYTYFAAFVAPGQERSVDIAGEICPLPRVFEWNVMHHPFLSEACVDIDGVLCRDPSIIENDDGPNYSRFLRTVEVFHLPKVKIAHLVTCRLEKYRSLTEEWLRRHNIQYGKLHMLNLSNAFERQRWCRHGEFKGKIYRESSECNLFIESSAAQAQEIADNAIKPVLCVENHHMVLPRTDLVIRTALCRLPGSVKKRATLTSTWLGRRLIQYVGYTG